MASANPDNQTEADNNDDGIGPKFPAELSRNQTLTIPTQGLNRVQLKKNMVQLQQYDGKADGRIFAYLYHSDDEAHHEFVADMYKAFIHENGLNATVFPALRKFEVEVVQMTLNLFHAPETAVGNMTSGGTESILCACKAYRDMARADRPEVKKPNFVLPITAHPAFSKAGHLLDVELIYVKDLDEGMRVKPEAVRAACNENTILIVGSAPQYCHGVIDPIVELGEVAKSLKLPLHVDACVGGFFLPWVEKLGYSVPTWDFRCDAVTSISADLHKYGYVSKGASVISWRNSELRKHQFYAYSGWPGGLFVSPSMLGTRPGGAIAAAFAGLCSMGQEGFLTATKKSMDTANKFRAGLASIPGLRVLGKPDMAIVAFVSDDENVNIFAVADVVQDKFGFTLERQQLPSCLHTTLMPRHAYVVDDLIKAIRESVEVVRKNPELATKGSAAMYGMVGSIPDNTIVEDFLTSYMDKVYSNL